MITKPYLSPNITSAPFNISFWYSSCSKHNPTHFQACMCSSACFISREMLGILVSLVRWECRVVRRTRPPYCRGRDTHIPSEVSMGIHISLVILVWGYTKHGDTHITVTPATYYPRASRSFPRIAGSGNEIVTL
jgi:hypothetical protein